jgi:hypothetical protein
MGREHHTLVDDGDRLSHVRHSSSCICDDKIQWETNAPFINGLPRSYGSDDE